MKRSVLFAICIALVCPLGSFAEVGQLPKPKPTPASGSKPASSPKKQAAAVPVMEAPKELSFSSKELPRTPGDWWTYLVSSADSSLDLQTLYITFEKEDPEKVVFTVQFGESEPRSAELPLAEATWFAPVEMEKGIFGLKGLGSEFPEKVETGVHWNKTARFFKYDDAGNRIGEEGYVLSSGAPRVCAVPAGAFACADIQRSALGESVIQSFIAISPRTPAALRSRVRRAGGTGMLLFELHSFEASGQSARATRILREVRQKAVEWIKQTNKFGEEADIVENFIFLLQEGIRTYPKATIQITVGRDVTKGGKVYALRWHVNSYTILLLTPAEFGKTPPKGISRTVTP